MDLNILECKKCGASFWFNGSEVGAVESGPCCFGYAVLDIETYPTEKTAIKAYPAFIKAQQAAIVARAEKLEALAKGKAHQNDKKAVAA